MESAVGLLPRITALVTGAEGALRRVNELVDRIEATRSAADAVVVSTGDLVSTTEELTTRLDALLSRFQPVLDRLHPTLERLAETTDPEEVAAVVAMVDMLPEIVVALRDDVIPILDTFGTVAPDVRDLLDTSRELNEMLASVPGFGRVRRRVEERQDGEDAYRAAGEPPPAPQRPD